MVPTVAVVAAESDFPNIKDCAGNGVERIRRMVAMCEVLRVELFEEDRRIIPTLEFAKSGVVSLFDAHHQAVFYIRPLQVFLGHQPCTKLCKEYGEDFYVSEHRPNCSYESVAQGGDLRDRNKDQLESCLCLRFECACHEVEV